MYTKLFDVVTSLRNKAEHTSKFQRCAFLETITSLVTVIKKIEV